MAILEILERAKRSLAEITNLKVSNVVGVSKYSEGWHIGIEPVERKSIPDTQDLLGMYEVTLDNAGEIVTYERKLIRRRMDTEA
jgi:hypothetical protein